MSFNPKFKIRDPQAERTSIRMQFYLNGQRFIYSLGPDRTISPSLWDQRRMRPISSKKNKCLDIKEQGKHSRLIKKFKNINPNISNDLIDIEIRIESVESKTRTFLSLKEQQGDAFSKEELKSYLDNSFGLLKTKEQKQSLTSFLNELIKRMESGNILIKSKTGNGKRYSKDTIKAYKVLESKLNEFSKGKQITFEDINTNFHNRFTKFMYDQNYGVNYFGNFIKNLKATMQRAFEDDLHTNLQFKKFIKVKEESTSIYLTENEVSKLYTYKFENPKYDKYRDLFLIGCWTALRFSDFRRITKEHIKDQDGIKVLDMIVQKGSQRVIIPLRMEVLSILKKYDFNVPKVSRQKMNDALKEIGEQLQFVEMIETKKIKGGLEIKKIVPKYELMKTHVGRRTGATLMYLAGIPSIDIMKITGHKTESQLLKYIKVTKKETAKRLSLNPFFRGGNLSAV